MIRIHTGGCPDCGSPIFVGFEEAPPTTVGMHFHIFHGHRYVGKIEQVMYTCECVVKADPETEE